MEIKKYKFFQKLQNLPFVEEIWLYGSRARGDEKQRSDFDIAIFCPSANEEKWHKILQIIEEADTLLKIDCVRYDAIPEEDKLKRNIDAHKILLYKKNAMEKKYWKDSFESLGDALNRLDEVLVYPDVDNNEVYRDAAIQRFEFSIELYWKVLKKILAYEKIDATTPRDVLRQSFQYGLIEDENAWLMMLDDRNRTSHLYSQDEARRVFNNIKSYFPSMKKNYASLMARYKGSLH